ncbi:hypothetical protein OK016_28765 [Vibrio chagasii]|nr:hypothetical protein [Vibrio chagasii]
MAISMDLQAIGKVDAFSRYCGFCRGCQVDGHITFAGEAVCGFTNAARTAAQRPAVIFKIPFKP